MKRAIRNTTAADRILLVILILVSSAGFLYTREAFSHGSDVIIEVDGKPAYTFPLNADRTVTISGANGNAVVEIMQNKVRMKEAHCDNQTCVKQGWISSGTIICLPGHIVVLVGGGAKKNVDAITG